VSHAISHAYLAARLLNRATLARILANMTGIRTRNETLLVGVLLTAVGGFLDAYTFVSHAVFANAQTGNVVLFGIETASRHWHEAFTSDTDHCLRGRSGRRRNGGSLAESAAGYIDRCGLCSARRSSFWRP
jgi:hypothetical protein